jgi:hypothetical protein
MTMYSNLILMCYTKPNTYAQKIKDITYVRDIQQWYIYIYYVQGQFQGQT